MDEFNDNDIVWVDLEKEYEEEPYDDEYYDDEYYDDEYYDDEYYDNSIIQICDLTMQFRINEANVNSIKEFFIKFIKKENVYRKLTALNDINLSIEQGEIVGVIGTNGSGKSTLLKIIAGALIPTYGEAYVDRSKVQLLTLGTGFDHELTAKENVYLNGAMIGYSQKFIDDKYDEIVAFAELDGFMEEKVKNFSSGMVSRLAFSIATIAESQDILILDEVLSVGDMFFKQKSERRIKEMIQSGATVIMVTHSTDTIIKNCTRAIWIEKGNLLEDGDPKEVCKHYKEYKV